MLFRPSLRNIWTLIVLAVICYSLYTWAEHSRVNKEMPHYDQKMDAAIRMNRALTSLAQAREVQGFTDSFGDPRLDAIIGQQFSTITTGFGTFETKVVGANPNFAALVVELLADAGVKEGDRVAVGFTGSHPGVNIAVLAACQAVGAEPVTITAVGSTWWGANDPDFTWLDIERFLNENNLIHSRPVAASLGGGMDEAVGLSANGKQLLRDAITRNQLTLIQEGSVTESSAKRFQVYSDAARGASYAAYINVGLGIASLGHVENARLIRNGIHRRLPVRNYPARGVIHLMNDARVPVINVSDIQVLSRTFRLGGPQVPLPDVGEGEVFIAEHYDLRIAGFATFIALVIIVFIVRLDSRLFRLRDRGVDPETLL